MREINIPIMSFGTVTSNHTILSSKVYEELLATNIDIPLVSDGHAIGHVLRATHVKGNIVYADVVVYGNEVADKDRGYPLIVDNVISHQTNNIEMITSFEISSLSMKGVEYSE